MFFKRPFELNQNEVDLVYKCNEIILETNWCQEGYMQEKGKEAEQLIYGLLSLCNVEVLRSKKSSVLDEVLKVDIVCRNLDDVKDVFAFQIKCSKYGAEQHYSKYGDEIEYENFYFRTPWCLIIDGSLSNSELFDLMIEELCLDFDLDMTAIDRAALRILSSNSKRIRKDSLGFKLSNKEDKALFYIYNIGKNKNTYFLRN